MITTQRQGTARRPGANSEGVRSLGDRLSRSEVELLVWRYYDGRTYSDIGSLLGITKQSAYDRVTKALTQLRRLGYPAPEEPKSHRVRLILFDPCLLDLMPERVMGGNDEEDFN